MLTKREASDQGANPKVGKGVGDLRPGTAGLWLGDAVARPSCSSVAAGLPLGDAAAGRSRGAANMGLAAIASACHARSRAPPSAPPGLPSPALSRTTYSPVVALRPLPLCTAHALLSAIAPLLSAAASCF